MVVHKMEYPYFLFASLLLVGLSSPHGNLDPITWKPLVIVDYLSYYPQAKGFLIWIYFALQATFNHSETHKPLDYKNNSSCKTVIKLLSKDLYKHRKPA